ncbi:beta-propeller fold lactonase family protein [Devosia sp. ZB163]|uniref:lactonase family protein n=1 Tax=Devosia sp. ZB163 TaxID=3025938 RepID=UPI00235E18AE|nr:beta-propeller fold lactonase family protein [Devosia sp. ZB163]MDC9826377.1 beta-propeller fold lactonase family protein [Devosia sp. ZB163]
MAEFTLGEGQALLVASRGIFELHGLTRWVQDGGQWRGKTLARVNQLSSLARHPNLPVVYGTSRVGMEGDIHAWRIEGDTAVTLGEKSSGGAEPCHLVVDPSGRLLIVTNYTTSTLGLQRLAADGSFDGPIDLLKLSGGGPEIERQDDAHPHQVFFVGDTLVVIDLGADLVREFSVDLAKSGTAVLTQVRATAVPANTGPRHAVVLPDGRLAVSGELGSNLVAGSLGDPASSWANVSSTRRAGPGKTRWTRNYPGDIQRALDGRHVYFANRSIDTVSTFDVTGPSPVLVSELDSQAQWPQHLLVTASHVLVAGWDSSTVKALPLADGVPTGVQHLFDCPGAGWLLLWD